MAIGLFWVVGGERRLLREHDDETSASADRDRCLERRRADVARALPLGGDLHGRKIDQATHDAHVGSFEIGPVDPAARVLRREG